MSARSAVSALRARAGVRGGAGGAEPDAPLLSARIFARPSRRGGVAGDATLHGTLHTLFFITHTRVFRERMDLVDPGTSGLAAAPPIAR